MRRNRSRYRSMAGSLRRKWCALAVTGCMAAGLLSGCGGQEEPALDSLLTAGQGLTDKQGQGGEQLQTGGTASDEGTLVGTAVLAETGMDAESMFTDRDRSGSYDSAECVKIELGDSDVTITEEGVYLISGTLKDGMILVDADESAKVQLILNNVEISNSTGAGIYVRQADKVFLTLAEGSVNMLSGGDSYVSIDDSNIDGVIFAKSNLTVNGGGSLQVTAVTGHGIVSKDDLKIVGGTVTVTASGHGLSGKDSVRIAEGEFPVSLSITAGKDGIHAENGDQEDKGFVYIGGGSITAVSDGDSISAGIDLQIDGGTFNLTAGKGSANKTAARDQEGNVVSAKGIKAGGQLLINDGSFIIDSQDDGLHSNSNLFIHNGRFDIATGDDGLHADEVAAVAGGTVNISTCYEGIEGNQVVISGGNIRLYASDDGLNAAGGRDGSGFGGPFGGGFGGGADSGSSLLISGGQIYINADGDGIDSNGTLTVTGGEIYISGPETGANGALDYESSAQITGGTLIALGNSGMAENFGGTSTQGSALIVTEQCGAGTEVSLEDEKGNVLAAYTAESRFNSVVISCPGMVQGGTYKICVGTAEYEVTLDSLIYGSGFGGFGGGGGRDGGEGFRGGRGGFGGGPGERPEMPGAPEDGELPGSGEWPEMPGTPGQSGDGEPPEMPGDGELPEIPGMPEDGELPGSGEWPEMPGTPGQSGDREPPEMPGQPGGGDAG